MNRRDFLRRTGTFVASAAVLSKLPACGGDDDNGTETGAYVFPQGLASGDPRPTSVVLWTRVQAKTGTTGAVPLKVEVSTDSGFATTVVSRDIEATESSDHTVRVIVTDLTPATFYYYRFTAGGDTISGRTRTAPDKNADVPVHYAWVSCQDYEAGVYHAYKQMLADDMTSSTPIEFVVHLGDFIYETISTGFQQAIDENFAPITVKNPDGSDRIIPAFPSGPQSSAQTLADYRHLYRTYLSDPDLQAARARWPFINIWDDHEFTNDCWQSQANYDDMASLDEPAATRRVAGNQAWFEYVPCQLTGADGVAGVPSEAKDFAPVTVTNAAFTAPNADNFVAEANNTAAVGSITIYRSFRFGKHLEMILSDERSYRSDHAVPEDLTFNRFQFFDPRNVLPFDMVNALDAGRTDNGGNPRTTVNGFSNPRTNDPPGTMLDAKQRAWVKESLKKSDATWKVWGNSVMLLRVFIRQMGLELLLFDRLMNADAWDGYNTERKELMKYIKDQGIKNVVSISGDVHAHFAGVLMDDYDAATPSAVGYELVAAGVTSNSLLSFYESATREGTPRLLRHVIVFDKDSAKNVENLNMMLLRGTTAAVKFSETNNLQAALAATDPTVNPHLKYADTNAQGYGLMSVTANSTTATQVTMKRPIGGSAMVLRSAKFTIPKDNPAGTTGPEITGTKGVPFA